MKETEQEVFDYTGSDSGEKWEKLKKMDPRIRKLTHEFLKFTLGQFLKMGLENIDEWSSEMADRIKDGSKSVLDEHITTWSQEFRDKALKDRLFNELTESMMKMMDALDVGSPGPVEAARRLRWAIGLTDYCEEKLAELEKEDPVD